MTCPKCNGTGWYSYDHNHGKPCEECCEHLGGWWPLGEGHRYGEGFEACKSPGCGAVRRIGTPAIIDSGAFPVFRDKPSTAR